jgi:hypothetical protein
MVHHATVAGCGCTAPATGRECDGMQCGEQWPDGEWRRTQWRNAETGIDCNAQANKQDTSRTASTIKPEDKTDPRVPDQGATEAPFTVVRHMQVHIQQVCGAHTRARGNAAACGKTLRSLFVNKLALKGKKDEKGRPLDWVRRTPSAMRCDAVGAFVQAYNTNRKALAKSVNDFEMHFRSKKRAQQETLLLRKTAWGCKRGHVCFSFGTISPTNICLWQMHRLMP